MNKSVTGVLFGIIIILFLLLMLLKSKSPFGKSNSSFVSEPHKGISKIEFSEGERKLFLIKEGDNWLLNGKIETRKSGILFILRILQEINIKSPVTDELFRREIKSKEIIPIRVKVYEQRKLLKTFLVYKTHSNIYGNVMKISERSKPFIVFVPGYEGDIGSAFNLNELFWQPYTVFNLLPSEIGSVYFENFTDTASSFSIISKNQRFIVFAENRELAGWDSVLVSRYLSYFTRVPFEKWIFDIDEEEKKMIASQQPLYRITVNTTDGKETVLTLWEKMAHKDGSVIKDSDKAFGKTQQSDAIFIMRYFDIDPLLKKRSYFFME